MQRTKPYFIGICGGSGSGKSTLASALLKAFPAKTATLISLDCYYRPRCDVPDAVRGNFDHPDSLDERLLAQHLMALSHGESVDKPRYDFICHDRFPDTECIKPSPIMIVDGILLFALSSVAEQLDLTVFVDAPADIRLARRIRRDIRERGRTMEDVLMQYFATVRPMHELYVEPCKYESDLVVSSMDDLHDEVRAVMRGWERHQTQV